MINAITVASRCRKCRGGASNYPARKAGGIIAKDLESPGLAELRLKMLC